MSAFYPQSSYWPKIHRGVEPSTATTDPQSPSQRHNIHDAIATKDWQQVQHLITQPHFNTEARDEVINSTQHKRNHLIASVFHRL
jgi:hypothetical protein